MSKNIIRNDKQREYLQFIRNKLNNKKNIGYYKVNTRGKEVEKNLRQ